MPCRKSAKPKRIYRRRNTVGGKVEEDSVSKHTRMATRASMCAAVGAVGQRAVGRAAGSGAAVPEEAQRDLAFVLFMAMMKRAARLHGFIAAMEPEVDVDFDALLGPGAIGSPDADLTDPSMQRIVTDVIQDTVPLAMRGTDVAYIHQQLLQMRYQYGRMESMLVYLRTIGDRLATHEEDWRRQHFASRPNDN